MSKHTPTPWQLARPDVERCRVVIETVERGVDLPDQGNPIAVAYWGTPIEEANAELIVRAVNCHEELLAAIKKAERELRQLQSPRSALTTLREALAKAEGKSK